MIKIISNKNLYLKIKIKKVHKLTYKKFKNNKILLNKMINFFKNK